MARKKMMTTKYEIIQTASECFMEYGYSGTSPNMIAKKMGISTGNLTYYYPTKEHLLCVMVKMLCDFQWHLVESEADRGIGSVASICLETMTVATACAESEVARDLFVSVFQSEICRNYLCDNHARRAKKIFAKQCADWSNEKFQAVELLVKGLQYAAIVPTDANIPVKMRIAGALHQILGMYNVAEDVRQKEIDRVLAMECRSISKQVWQEFIGYVERTNQQHIEALKGDRLC